MPLLSNYAIDTVIVCCNGPAQREAERDWESQLLATQAWVVLVHVTRVYHDAIFRTAWQPVTG